MSHWISVLGRSLATGTDAELIGIFFKSVRSLVDGHGESHTDLVRQLILGKALNFGELSPSTQDALKRIASVLLSEGVGTKLGTMRSTLGTVRDQAASTPVILGFPLHAFSLEPVDVSRLPVGLNLATESAIDFTIAPDDSRDTPIGSVLAALRLRGDIAFNANLSVPIATLAGVAAATSVTSERAVEYLTSYDSRIITWRAVHDAMARVQPIDNYEKVRESFQRSPPQLPGVDADNEPATGALDEIRVIGNDALRVNANATLRIPLAKAGTLSGHAEGEVNLGGGFTISIKQTRSSRNRGEQVLVVSAQATSGLTRTAGAGIGYAFGISNLSPLAASTLLGALVDADRIVQNIDHGLGVGKTFLRPGTLVKDVLSEKILAALSEPDAGLTRLQIALGDVVGLDADGNQDIIAQASAAFFATLLDNAAGLFGPDHDKALSVIFKPVAAKLEGQVRDRLDGIVSSVSDHLEAHVNAAADALDEAAKAQLTKVLGRAPDDTVDGLRQFLSQSRELLTSVTKKVAARNLDLVAAEIAWTRGAEEYDAYTFGAEISAEGHEFYKGVIWRPSTGADRLLSAEDGPVPGVYPLTAERSSIAQRLKSRTWNVGLIDAMVSAEGSERSFAEVSVSETLSGVSVGTLAWHQSREELDFFLPGETSREVRLTDALSFVSTDGEGGERVETGQLCLSYTWVEEGALRFSRREMEKFCDTFHDVALMDAGTATALHSLRDQAHADGGRRPKARLRAFLTVPPDFGVKVIRHVADHPSWAKEIIKDVVGHGAIRGETFDRRRIDALVQYFQSLDTIRGQLMGLPDGADARARIALRRQIGRQNKRAQQSLKDHDWISTTFFLGLIADRPRSGILALFRCIAELSAQTPSCGRPGMVYTFTAQGETPELVITPRAGQLFGSGAADPLDDHPFTVRFGLLEFGSTGEGVRELQKRLVAFGFRIDVDGDFAVETDDAVRRFQAFSRMNVDGVVGNRTWRALLEVT
ncbi:MAG: peptidoglycan-binding domain-containing protein [Pseudomonadota bacterium]